jgi:hypothetical protein
MNMGFRGETNHADIILTFDSNLFEKGNGYNYCS